MDPLVTTSNKQKNKLSMVKNLNKTSHPNYYSMKNNSKLKILRQKI